MHDIVIDERQENERLLEKCITERIIPYDIVLVELVKDNDSPFSLFLTYIDDFYDEVKNAPCEIELW